MRTPIGLARNSVAHRVERAVSPRAPQPTGRCRGPMAAAVRDAVGEVHCGTLGGGLVALHHHAAGVDVDGGGIFEAGWPAGRIAPVRRSDRAPRRTTTKKQSPCQSRMSRCPDRLLRRRWRLANRILASEM
jgi:hypothetical protein